MSYCVGDIVYCNFPKTDGSEFQDRTVLLVAQVFGNDVIGCMVTKKKNKFDPCIEISNDNMADGFMPFNPSYIRPARISTIDSTKIRRKVGTVKFELLSEVRQEIRKKFE